MEEDGRRHHLVVSQSAHRHLSARKGECEVDLLVFMCLFMAKHTFSPITPEHHHSRPLVVLSEQTISTLIPYVHLSATTSPAHRHTSHTSHTPHHDNSDGSPHDATDAVRTTIDQTRTRALALPENQIRRLTSSQKPTIRLVLSPTCPGDAASHDRRIRRQSRDDGGGLTKRAMAHHHHQSDPDPDSERLSINRLWMRPFRYP
jgi:hypothetical protein